MDDDKEMHQLDNHFAFALSDDDDPEDDDLFKTDGEEGEEEYS